MKLKSGLIVLLISLMMAGNVFAADWAKNRTGNWHDTANWVGGVLPNGLSNTTIRWNTLSICTLNTVEDWGTDLGLNRLSLYQGATLNILPGASLIGPGWFRVGTSSSGSTMVNQSGGTIILKVGQDTSKLVIGDSVGPGIYTMTGGTITYDTGDGGDGQLVIGDRGGTGTFILSGTTPVIQMKNVYVGGKAADTSNGTLQYNISASGVSAIHCVAAIKLDLGGTSSTANLVVNGSPADTSVPILLIENSSSSAVVGKFDHLNGGDANEGATILLGSHPYALTYMYDSNSRTVGSACDGTYNDIALIPTSVTISTPAVTTGNLLIAAVATGGNTSATIAPSDEGWTPIDCGANGSDVTLGVWWKLAEDSEPNTHTFAWTGAAVQAYGWMMSFSGYDAAHPINTSVSSDDFSSTPTSPEVTTTVNNCLILRLGAFDDGDITVDNPGLTSPLHTTITMDKSNSIASSGVVSGGAGYVRQSGKGLSGNSNFSLLSAKAARMLTIAIAPNDTGKNACCEDDITP